MTISLKWKSTPKSTTIVPSANFLPTSRQTCTNGQSRSHRNVGEIQVATWHELPHQQILPQSRGVSNPLQQLKRHNHRYGDGSTIDDAHERSRNYQLVGHKVQETGEKEKDTKERKIVVLPWPQESQKAAGVDPGVKADIVIKKQRRQSRRPATALRIRQVSPLTR